MRALKSGGFGALLLLAAALALVPGCYAARWSTVQPNAATLDALTNEWPWQRIGDINPWAGAAIEKNARDPLIFAVGIKGQRLLGDPARRPRCC